MHLKTKDIAIRKQPSQRRSEEMVSKILSATQTLLKSKGFVDITTNHIAKQANISVGSLYQYFPNKEAIFSELYSYTLGKIRETFEEFNQQNYLNLPREVFFEKLIDALKVAEKQSGMNLELSKAIKVFPSLAELDQLHAELTSKEFAKLMRHFGSNWPMAKLNRLALFVYYINFGSWNYRQHVGSHEKECEEWESLAVQNMIARCFS